MYIYLTSLSVHLLVNGWVVFISWLVQIMLQWTWRYRYVFELVLLFCLIKYTEVRLLDHTVVLFLIFEELQYCFPYARSNIHCQQQSTKVLFSPHPHQYLLFLGFIIIAMLTGVGWYLIVAVIFILLVVLSTFLVPVGHLYVFFGKISIQIFCPFFNQIAYA